MREKTSETSKLNLQGGIGGILEEQLSCEAILEWLSRKIPYHKQLQHSTTLAWLITLCA
jgi:hypothetical protein